jgi:hypothetical protein
MKGAFVGLIAALAVSYAQAPPQRVAMHTPAAVTRRLSTSVCKPWMLKIPSIF